MIRQTLQSSINQGIIKVQVTTKDIKKEDRLDMKSSPPEA